MKEKTADIDILEEKEKKAINNLNFIVVTDIYDNEVSIDKTKIINEYNESVGIVLNLVKNLISENKELKEENRYLKSKIDEFREKYIELNKDSIAKSKVEELKDKIHRELEINAVTRRDLIYVDLNLARIDEYFNALLGKE